MMAPAPTERSGVPTPGAVAPTYSLVTKVLDRRHAIILRDWLEFLSTPPRDIAIYAPSDGPTRRTVSEVAEAFELPCSLVPPEPGDDLQTRETDVLRRLAAATRGEYLLTVNLDTLPFRAGDEEEHWLEEAFELMQGGSFAFLTGDGIRFHDDRSEGPGRFLRTRCFSNNFGLIQRAFWEAALDRHPRESKSEPGRRYHSEWAVNDEALRQERWGLRRFQTMSWRVLHVQQWDERLFVTRDLFRRGIGVRPYLNLFYEDHRHPWQLYFNYPRPPILKRVRIRLGEIRRELF